MAGAGWDYGSDVAYVRELCDYWADAYDWAVRDSDLNALVLTCGAHDHA
jgi:microsomal epoxide hydrolase